MDLSCTLPPGVTMHHAIYANHNSFYKSFLDQQPSYPPQPDPTGEAFIDAGDGWTCVDVAPDSAGLLPEHLGISLDGCDIYPTISGGSAAAVTSQYPVFLSSDSSDVPEAFSKTSIFFHPTGPIAYPSTPLTASFLDPITSQAVQPSFTSFTSNGVRHYRCICGHETRRTGDMRRHHESSKHSHRKHFCSLCEKRFTRRDGLRRHMKKMHSQSLVIGFEASSST